jgi:GH35 family endo-1,4-beta-xylanase
MSKRILSLAAWAVVACLTMPAWAQPGDAKKDNKNGPTIKDVYQKHFLIGVAGDLPGNYSDEELGLVKGHFNVVTPENCMKPGPVHPSEDRWSFERPDALVRRRPELLRPNRSRP